MTPYITTADSSFTTPAKTHSSRLPGVARVSMGLIFVPLALALIAPVVVNIVAFHALLEPAGLGLAAVVMGLEAYLAWTYRRAYRPMLEMRP